MKFDLFDAMAIMKHHFGDDGEILLMQQDGELKVRLRAFKNREFHNSEFIILKKDIADKNIKRFDMLFKAGILNIHKLIEQSVN